MILTYSMFKINYLALTQHRKTYITETDAWTLYFSDRKQRGPLSKRKRVCIYKKVNKIHNIPIATHSLVKLRWPFRYRIRHVARRTIIMKIQMKVRQCHHLYHLWYVSARTNLRIGTGLEGRVQTYRSGAGQLVQLDMLRQWILLLLQMTVRYQFSNILIVVLTRFCNRRRWKFDCLWLWLGRWEK
jgi:hypothetical protein